VLQWEWLKRLDLYDKIKGIGAQAS